MFVLVQKIAKMFSGVLFWGRVTGLPKRGESYYSVEYSDGDRETMKIVEMLSCIDLYNKHNK